MAVAFLALFVTIAGTAAATRLITGRDIKNGSITARDIRNGSITSRDIRNGTLRPRDFRGRRLPRGRRGPRGPAGPPGPAGRAGAVDLAYASASASLTAQGTAGDEAYVVAACPRGRYPVGGDAYAVEVNPSDPEDPVDPEVDIAEGFTVNVGTGTPSGWFGRATNDTSKAFTLFVDAICTSADRPPAPIAAQAAAGRRGALAAGRAK